MRMELRIISYKDEKHNQNTLFNKVIKYINKNIQLAVFNQD